MPSAKRLLLIGTENHLVRGVVRGVHDYCRAHGKWEYHLETEDSPQSVKRTHFTLCHWKPHGIIGRIFSVPMVRLIRRSGVPAINVSNARYTGLPRVTMDDQAAGALAAEHFLDNGFRRFAFCALTGELFAHKRHEGFCRRLAESGFTCEVFADETLTRKDFDWVRNCRKMEQWIISLHKPIAILCTYDLRGHDVILACRRLGFRVPDDIAVAGIDNHEAIAQMCTPPLSSVALNFERVGYEAARWLEKSLRHRMKPSTHILIPPNRMVIRQSSDIMALDDPDVAEAMRIIRDRAGSSLNVSDLLDQVPISQKAMERRFLRLIGRTPKAEIMRVRIDRSKALLAETDWSIGKIATDCGFGGHEAFCIAFRRKTDLTPTRYRRLHRK